MCQDMLTRPAVPGEGRGRSSARRRTRRRRLNRRGHLTLAAAACCAILANAGAAWVYWSFTQSGTGHGSSVELVSRARSDLNRPLTPGTAGNLTVTVTNDYDVPIAIASVGPGVGAVLADDEHRDAGCVDDTVTLSRGAFAVSWHVPKNTVGAFSIPAGLLMARTASDACTGATFSLPIQIKGATEL